MSRYIIGFSLAVLLLAGAVAAGEMAWFDMDNCAMCSNISSNTKLMKNISWDQYPISNGIVSVTTVKAYYVDDYRKAHAKMVEMGTQLQSGERMEMCGSCMALGMCMMTGPSQEYVETPNGDIWILTSDDEKVVTALHEWAERNKKEKMKMESKG